MKIRRICIRNFRKLTDPVTIEGIQDGLTVLAGENEEGKSTVLAAVQSVFFNRHRIGGEPAKAMQPFGSSVRPEISVDFELDSQSYSLRKAFCQRPEAELVTATGKITGDAVEDRLQELLRFEPSKKGEAKPEHRGIWGLFWIEQGASFAPLHINCTSRESIVSALESEVGQVLGGERGRALLAAIEKRHGEYFTTTRKPRGQYRESLERKQALAKELDELRGKLGAYDAKVDKLGDIKARLKRYRDHNSLARAATDLKTLKEEEKRVQALAGALENAEKTEQLALAQEKSAHEKWKLREDKIKKAAEAAKDAEKLQKETDAAEHSAEAARKEKDKAGGDVAEAKTDLGRAQAILTNCQRNLQRARLEENLRDMSGRLTKARTAQEEAQKARREVAAIKLDENMVSALRQKEKHAETAKLRLETVATRLEFAPEAGRTVLQDGPPIATDAPLLLTGKTVLQLEGFGKLTVTPGGDDLERLRRDAEDREQNFADALQAAGVNSLSEGEDALRRKNGFQSEVQRCEAIVQAHAPEGVERLQQETELKQSELVDLSQGPTDPAPALDDAQAHYDAAREDVAKKETALQKAEQVWNAADDLHRKAREFWVTVKADYESALRRSSELARELETDRQASGDAQLQAALTEASEALSKAKAVTQTRRNELEQANPEELRLRLDRAEEAYRNIRSDIDKLTNQETELTVELRTLGQAGLGETIQDTEAQYRHTSDYAVRMQREACALDLLMIALKEAERHAKETFFGPVQAHILPYLKLLFPGCELVLGDEDLGRFHLRRDGVDEPFEALSVGTREQLAILTRLAFADFLREKGQPAALILDDALVYADDQRFDLMQLVLRKAAEHLQVLVLTCREREYHGLGAPIIRLSDCKGVAV